MSYKDQILNKKFHEDNDIINKEIYNKYYENYNLAIRKKHIFNFLLSKRKLQRNLMNNNPYEININSVPSNKEMMKNPITYIKTRFNINSCLKNLVTNNINQIKEILFLLKTYILIQMDDSEINEINLTSNFDELINILCELMLHNDKQIAYTSCNILINLFNFSDFTQSSIYTENNLNKITIFFIKFYNVFRNETLILITNITTNRLGIKYFLENCGMEKIIEISKDNNNNFEICINIIKIISNISVIFSDNINFKYKNNFLRLLHFIKEVLKKYCEENISDIECQDYINYFNRLLKFYSVLDNDNEILNNNYIQTLINYYKKTDDNQKYDLMQIFINLFSKNDLIKKEFISNNLLNILLTEINRTEFNNNLTLLDIMIYAVSTLSNCCYNINQMISDGIIFKIIEICIFYINKKNDETISSILHNSTSVIVNAIINNCNQFMKLKLLVYKNFMIIDIFSFMLEKNLDICNKICLSINEFIILLEETVLDQNIINGFKQKLIMNNIVQLLISNSHLFNNKDDYIYDIINFIK